MATKLRRRGEGLRWKTTKNAFFHQILFFSCFSLSLCFEDINLQVKKKKNNNKNKAINIKNVHKSTTLRKATNSLG